MNDDSNTVNSADDSWLESLLRTDGEAHRGDYVADEGFTARVMDAIPAPAALPAWRKPALAAVWAVAGLGIAVALPGAITDVAQDALRILFAQHFSLRDIGAGILGIAGLSWAGTLYALRHDQ